MVIRALIVLFCLFALTACTQKNPDPNPSLNLKNISRTITPNAHKSQILRMFGDPQVVERDMNGREIWVYDKMFTFKKHSDRGLSFLDFQGGEYFIGAGVAVVAANLLWNSLNFKEEYRGLGSLVAAAVGATSIGFLRDGDFDRVRVESVKTMTLLLEFRGDRLARYSYHKSSF